MAGDVNPDTVHRFTSVLNQLYLLQPGVHSAFPSQNDSFRLYWVDPGGPVVIILSSGCEVRGFDLGRDRWIFQSVKILTMTSFGREISRGSHVVDLRHVKAPQAEIRASDPNLSDFSHSMLEATLMIWGVEKCKTQRQQDCIDCVYCYSVCSVSSEI